MEESDDGLGCEFLFAFLFFEITVPGIPGYYFQVPEKKEFLSIFLFFQGYFSRNSFCRNIVPEKTSSFSTVPPKGDNSPACRPKTNKKSHNNMT